MTTVEEKNNNNEHHRESMYKCKVTPVTPPHMTLPMSLYSTLENSSIKLCIE